LPLLAADYDINRHATVLVRTHPANIASSISVNADDQSGEVEATFLLQVNNCVSASLLHENEIVRIEGISLSLSLTIRLSRGVDVLGDGIGKIKLTGDHVAVVDERLEVDMWSAPWIPAGVDRSEPHMPGSPDELRSAQERLALCRTGILTRRIRVPNVHPSALKGRAVGLDRLKSEHERSAPLSFGYVAANELRIEIEGAPRQLLA
jgi:hypothetical protein